MFVCKDLLKNLTYECVRGNDTQEVTEVVIDSRKITPGCLFICISGYKVDGHDFAAEAAQKGAAVLVVQKEVELPEDCYTTVIKVADTR